MKRFFCALVVLSITITAALTLNRKIIAVSDEISEAIGEENREKIVSLWEDSKVIFSLLLPQSTKERIQIIINDVKEKSAPADELKELKNEIESVKDSLILNFENIL